MEINGYWFGAGIVMILEYIWFLFKAPDRMYSDISCSITIITLIIFFGFAFKKEKQK